MKLLIRWLIRGYQLFISPALRWIAGPQAGCRFEPSCSAYFLEAVEVHGAYRGSLLGLKRIGRCQPWGGQGFDPVPPVGPGSPSSPSSPSSSLPPTQPPPDPPDHLPMEGHFKDPHFSCSH